jgi:hypothetical protein
MFDNEGRAAKAGAVGLAVRSRVVLILPRFLPEFFRAAFASGFGLRDRLHDRETFLRAVAEACSSQRLREENAVVGVISRS